LVNGCNDLGLQIPKFIVSEILFQCRLGGIQSLHRLEAWQVLFEIKINGISIIGKKKRSAGKENDKKRLEFKVQGINDRLPGLRLGFSSNFW
jgi:hypothetical protein